ncbi:hypothetical protein Nepgr_023028 [Nepenthes gracilis]|uniref:Uncharacterized protein n=1 Tax=Nepenthes gracilis TaxID=150966 RepID=A0AAD3T3L1_NEPGR|nr:hypothetical protein Nepgr_023028 [Nepenthes gracilis]
MHGMAATYLTDKDSADPERYAAPRTKSSSKIIITQQRLHFTTKTSKLQPWPHLPGVPTKSASNSMNYVYQASMNTSASPSPRPTVAAENSSRGSSPHSTSISSRKENSNLEFHPWQQIKGSYITEESLFSHQILPTLDSISHQGQHELAEAALYRREEQQGPRDVDRLTSQPRQRKEAKDPKSRSLKKSSPKTRKVYADKVHNPANQTS